MSMTVEALASEIHRLIGIHADELAEHLLPFIERHIAAGDMLRTDNPDREDFTVEQALRIADQNDAAYKHVPSVSRTLAAEVRRLATPKPAAYDRELIAKMLESAPAHVFGRDSIREQIDLLRAANNAEAAGVRTARREPKPAAAVPLPEVVAWQGCHDPTDLYCRKPAQVDVKPLHTADQVRTYGDAREAAGRTDAVPASAVRKFVIAARTSGGTAGRDEVLCAALDEVEAILANSAPAPQPMTTQGEAQDDTAARSLYNKWTDSHDKIHCNRFPAWSELDKEDRAEWRDKALRATGADHD